MVLQRPHRGARVSSFYPVKALPPLSALDSAFQLQEYISLLIRLDVHDVDAIVALPGKPPQKDELDSPDTDPKKSDDNGERKSDITVDRACWVYEQLRRLAQDLSHPLITMLQQECTRSSCPQMKAGEWLYLCVAHGNDGAMEQCCAIDYILHTVDSATALLNSPRAFPSRLSIPQTSHRHFSSLARRLGRIFAHAYFHHREAFEQAEAESSLYARFLKLTNQFDLVPAEFLVIPESAIQHDDKSHPEQVEPPRLYSAAVHPTPIPENASLTADTMPDLDQLPYTRSSAVDAVSQFGTDSPRKLGRNRTDTMVFSEAYSVAEELSKSDEDIAPASETLLNISPVNQTQSLVSPQSEFDLEVRTEDVDDEDIDARSESTIAVPLSPPVEELSLVSLDDTSALTALQQMGPDGGLSDPPPVEWVPEVPVQEVDVPVENTPVTEPQTIGVAEPASSDVDTAASGLSTQSIEDLPGPEEAITIPVDQAPDTISSSSNSEPQSAELQTGSELPPPTTQPVLELNEPPPSEPIPPESESDITDEAGGLGGDEVKEGGEEEAAADA